MSSFVRKVLRNVLSSVGGYPTALTPKDDVVALLNRLHPVKSQHELIRMGGGDGGYLIPNDLGGIEACFSPGVDMVSEFERHCAERGMQVFLADKSVNKPAAEHENFHFIKKYVGASTGDGFITMDDWVRESLTNDDSELLLQMDIEEFEYEVFFSMSDLLMRRFRIMVIEFHRLDLLFSKPYFFFVSRVFDKILRTHTCVHLHPNNAGGVESTKGVAVPVLLEATFLRSDRLVEEGFASTFPHPLDADNTDQASIVLPRTLYR